MTYLRHLSHKLSHLYDCDFPYNYNSYVRTNSLKDRPWVNSKPTVELITQKDPIITIQLLQTLGIPTEVKQLPLQENPLDYVHYDIHIDILESAIRKMG